MLEFQTTNKFDKDLKKNLKRGKDKNKIQKVMNMIINEIPLDPNYKDHKLYGDWKDCRRKEKVPGKKQHLYGRFTRVNFLSAYINRVNSLPLTMSVTFFDIDWYAFSFVLNR